MDRIAVLIPCWNEALTIRKVVTDFKRELPEAVIYVYDNNSTDDTAAIAREAGAVVRKEYRQGKGNVIRSMFRDIDAECYIMTDGDDTYPAECAREMADMVLSGQADMVVGDRLSSSYFEENKRPFHNSGNVVVRRFINMFWGKNSHDIKDVMTGYRAFSTMFVKTFPILSKGFEIETEMTIHALDKNLLIRNLPVSYRDRPEGSVSKLHTFRDGTRVLRTIFLLYTLTEYGGLPPLYSAPIAFTVSLILNYFLCVSFVFHAEHQSRSQVVLFVVTSLMGLGINQVTMWIFIDLVGIWYMFAKVIASAIVMIWNYFTKRFILHH